MNVILEDVLSIINRRIETNQNLALRAPDKLSEFHFGAIADVLTDLHDELFDRFVMIEGSKEISDNVEDMLRELLDGDENENA